MYTSTKVFNILLRFLSFNTKFFLVVDTYFSHIRWLKAYTNNSITFFLALDELCNLFVYYLQYHYYQVFLNDKIFFSI